MRIRTFLDNGSDDFNAPIPAPIADPTSGDYFLCWFDAKKEPSPQHGGISRTPSFGRDKTDRFAIRREPFGGLLLDRGTGKIHELDHLGVEALTLLTAGVTPSSVVDRLEVSDEELNVFIRYCLSERILTDAPFQ